MNNREIKQYFQQYGTKFQVKKETSVCSPRLSDSYVYYIVKGIASLSSMTREGEEQDFIYFPQDHIIGFVPALMRHYRKQKNEELPEEAKPCFGIDTKTDCVFYRMEEKVFERLISEDTKFLASVMEAVTCNYVTLVKKYHTAQEEKASGRLYQWLLDFSAQEGGVKVVPNGFTYAEIAKYLGMHPVTVSKLASQLKKEGIIKKEKGRIVILEENKLKSMIN